MKGKKKKERAFFWTHGLKPILTLLKHDFKTILKNRAALIIVIGLCVLPSLYAWINIYACWDPYGNTGNLPVAIVNNDEGAVFEDKIINVGDRIVDEMKENTSINWYFVDDWQANYGLTNGQYYAMIEIPSNFSQRLTSLKTATPQKPMIVYKANEKLNAIAAKITNVAKEKLINNVKSNFVKTVNEQVIETFNVEAEKPDAKEFDLNEVKERLTQLDVDLEALITHLNRENENELAFQSHLIGTNAQMQVFADQLDHMNSIIQATIELNRSQNSIISDSINEIYKNIESVRGLSKDNKALLEELSQINANGLDVDLLGNLFALADICDEISKQLDDDITKLEQLKQSEDNGLLSLMKSSLVYVQNLTDEEKNLLIQLTASINDKSNETLIQSQLDDLEKLNDEISSRLETVLDFSIQTVVPSFQTLSWNLDEGLKDTSQVLETFKILVPQYAVVTDFLVGAGDLSNQQREQMIESLESMEIEVHNALDKVSRLDGARISRLIELLKDNPSEITDFMASPLNVEVKELYEVKSFGVAIAPFYSVLAIWVGVLLMSSLISVESKGLKNVKIGHIHFGKMLLYLIISLIQSGIIVLGDIYILGIVPKDMGLMFAFAMMTSLTFVVIIYTLASVLGNIGKAVAIVIMIFQIAGSGGIYPIETNPEIFGRLMPIWPFTYAISGFRESILGPVGGNVSADMYALLKIIAVMLPFGLLRGPFQKLIHYFEHKFEEADLK